MTAVAVRDGSRATCVFLFTEAESCSALGKHDAQRKGMALMAHDLIFREAMEESGGRIFKAVSDGLCAVFGRTGEAVSVALTARRALASLPDTSAQWREQEQAGTPDPDRRSARPQPFAKRNQAGNGKY